MHEPKPTLESMRSLTVATPSEKNNSLSSANSSSGRAGSWGPTPPYPRPPMLESWLPGSCAGNHGCREFISGITTACPEVCTSPLPSPSSSALFYSQRPTIVSEACAWPKHYSVRDLQAVFLAASSVNDSYFLTGPLHTMEMLTSESISITMCLLFPALQRNNFKILILKLLLIIKTFTNV